MISGASALSYESAGKKSSSAFIGKIRSFAGGKGYNSSNRLDRMFSPGETRGSTQALERKKKKKTLCGRKDRENLISCGSPKYTFGCLV